MPEQDLDVEKEFEVMLGELLAQRTELAKLVDAYSDNPLLSGQLTSLKGACAALDRAATKLRWGLEAGQAKDLDDNPRRIRKIRIAQLRLLEDSLDTIAGVVEALGAEDDEQEEPVN